MPAGRAGEECRRGMAATEDAEQLAQVFSAYLDVPEEAALGATCQALVRAIKAGDVSLDTLLLFTQPVTDSGELFEAGRLLRAIFFAHRLTTRSEEHTSELQSLMRISYAVFCLKKQIFTNTGWRIVTDCYRNDVKRLD